MFPYKHFVKRPISLSSCLSLIYKHKRRNKLKLILLFFFFLFDLSKKIFVIRYLRKQLGHNYRWYTYMDINDINLVRCGRMSYKMSLNFKYWYFSYKVLSQFFNDYTSLLRENQRDYAKNKKEVPKRMFDFEKCKGSIKIL